MAKAQPLPQEKISKGSGFSGLKDWAKKKPAEAGLVGAGVVIAAIFLLKKKSAATTAAATTNTSGIDPATGIPYATEAAASQQNSPYSTLPGDVGQSSYGGGGGGYGGTAGNGLSDFESWFATNYPNGTQTTAVASVPSSPGSGPGPDPMIPGASSTAPATDPGPIYSPPPPIAALSGAITNLSPAQAKQAVAAGAPVRQALAAETSASAETSKQRHAQEVANRNLRKQL